MDWLRLRKALQEARVAAGIDTPAELARRINVEKSTAYRIEDLAGWPDLKPDLDTIDAWLQATSKAPLSRFFFELEDPVRGLQSDTGERQDALDQPGVSHYGTGADVSTGAADRAHDRFLEFLYGLNDFTTAAIIRAQADRSDTGARRAVPPSSGSAPRPLGSVSEK